MNQLIYQNENQVKLFLLSLEDLHNNRFKNGWFTLLKFTEQVKVKPEIMVEMQEFSKTKIEKPIVESYYQATQPVAVHQKKKSVFVRRNLQIGAEEEEKKQEV